jgi:hypothetical protein
MAVLAALATGVVATGIGGGVNSALAAPLWSQLEPSASASGSKPGNATSVITYAEETPCDPTPVVAKGDPTIVHRRPLHKARRHPILHRAVLHASAPVLPKPKPIIHEPAVHRAIPHTVVARVRRRRLHSASVAMAAAPKRCVTLHSERLNSADLVYDGGPVAALDVPAALVMPDSTPDFGLGGGDSSGFTGGGGGGGGGGGAFPNPVTGGVGGGGVITGSGSGSVSAAPEPQTWMLMILGVGLCGGALRRNRRTVVASQWRRTV